MKLSSPFTEDQVSELFASLDLHDSIEAERNIWREDPSPTTQCNYASMLVCTFGPFEQEMGLDLLLDVLSDKSSPREVVKKTLNHLCLGYFRQKNFQSASQYSLQCLEKFPRDQMAQFIYNIIQMKLLDSRLEVTPNPPIQVQSPQADKEEEVQTMLKKLVRKASMTTLRLEEIFSNVESTDTIYDGSVDANDQDDLFADIDALITTVPSTGKRKDTLDGKQAIRTQPRLATKSMTVANAPSLPTPTVTAPSQPSPTLTTPQSGLPSLPPMPVLPPNLPPPNLPPPNVLPPNLPPPNILPPSLPERPNGDSTVTKPSVTVEKEEWNPFGLPSDSASPRQQQNQMTPKQRAAMVAERVKNEAAAIIEKEREQAELNSTSPRNVVGPNAQQPPSTANQPPQQPQQQSLSSSVSQLMQNFQQQNVQPAPTLPQQRHNSTPFQRENSQPNRNATQQHQQSHFNTNPHSLRGERELHHQPHSTNLLSGLTSIGGFQIQFQAGPRPDEFNHAPTSQPTPFVSEQQLMRERLEAEERERREKARAEERAKEQAFVNAERKKQLDEREQLERERLEWEAIREERRIRQEKEREEAERQERARAEAERIAAEQEALEEKDDCSFCKKTFKASMLAEFSGRLLCASCMKLIMQRMKQKEQIAASQPPPEPKRNIYSIRSANGKVGTVTSAEKLLAALATYTEIPVVNYCSTRAVKKQNGAENDFLLKEIASTFNI